MVIGTSVIMAFLRDEPERRSFNEAIEAAPEEQRAPWLGQGARQGGAGSGTV
jgi:uncharacterized protein with PIN domain